MLFLWVLFPWALSRAFVVLSLNERLIEQALRYLTIGQRYFARQCVVDGAGVVDGRVRCVQAVLGAAPQRCGSSGCDNALPQCACEQPLASQLQRHATTVRQVIRRQDAASPYAHASRCAAAAALVIIYSC